MSDLVETPEDTFSRVTTLKTNSVTVVTTITDGVLVFFLGERLQDQWSLNFISSLSHDARKLSIWFPTRSDTNQAVQSRTRARGLKVGISEVEGLYYLKSKNNDPDQLSEYRKSDLPLCFHICILLVFL